MTTAQSRQLVRDAVEAGIPLPPRDSEPCLIWSASHDAWWRPNECGYTRDLLTAGVYTREHAERCARGDRVVPLEDALAKCRAEGTVLGELRRRVEEARA